jgi:hypothetical protein
MSRNLLFYTLSILFVWNSQSFAAGMGCYDGIDNCDGSGGGGGSSRSSSSSSTGGKVKINPAAVPTDSGFGIETITFKTSTDLGLVRGNGRIGAAISPTNSEETFFGPPGFSEFTDWIERKTDKEKFPSQKTTLATAVNIIQKKGTSLGSYNLKLGLMARYNKLTHSLTPGVGLNGAFGPISFGGSVYDDQTQIDDYDINGDPIAQVYKYQVRTHSIGLFLSALMLDYSHLELNTEPLAFVDLYTASLFYKKFIFTASRRIENSSMPYFNFETQAIETKQIKEEVFGGVQYNFTKNILIGGLYNYYMLHEYSLTATLFF